MYGRLITVQSVQLDIARVRLLVTGPTYLPLSLRTMLRRENTVPNTSFASSAELNLSRMYLAFSLTSSCEESAGVSVISLWIASRAHERQYMQAAVLRVSKGSFWNQLEDQRTVTIKDVE